MRQSCSSASAACGEAGSRALSTRLQWVVVNQWPWLAVEPSVSFGGDMAIRLLQYTARQPSPRNMQDAPDSDYDSQPSQCRRDYSRKTQRLQQLSHGLASRAQPIEEASQQCSDPAGRPRTLSQEPEPGG